jgi:hypothetical protein
MTEHEWLAPSNLDDMLEHLRGTVSDRKLVLFCCACGRRLWHLLPDARSRRAIEAAERSADGLLSQGDMEAAWQGAEKALNDLDPENPQVSIGLLAQAWAAQVAMRVAEAATRTEDNTFDLLYHAESVAMWSRDALAYFGAKDVDQVVDPPEEVITATDIFDHRDDEQGPADEHAYYRLVFSDRVVFNGRHANSLRSSWLQVMHAQRELLREVVGNPFRPVALDAAWLRWRGNTPARLAQAIYEEGAFKRLPVLADALEEAGRTITDVLNHCRQPGEHVRGCWVVDWLLGKT